VLLQTLKIEDLSLSAERFVTSATIQDVEILTSYSWVDRKGAEPTILIPGAFGLASRGLLPEP
jgi:hypothetical protein